jgi:hypothetical protein
MSTPWLPTKPVCSIVVESLGLHQAKREVSTAWEQYKQSTIKRFKDGLEFGRACHEWQAKFKAQGSHNGEGFEHLLEHLGIPKTTAYRWIKRYEAKIGLRATRNEVEHDPHSSPTFKKRSSFDFFLTEERWQQFEEDVRLLGGHKKVANIFLHFLSQKAFEMREANAATGKNEQ